MDNTIEFNAPWSASLRRSSTVTAIALSALGAAGIATAHHVGWLVTLTMTALPFIILLAALPFMIRGYIVTDKEIIVRRLGWVTHFPLAGLVAVAGNNEAMSKSIRLFGNGGLFSYSGEFWNRTLGRYRALATDPSRAVILRYPQRRIVVTPGDPQRFIVRVRTLLKHAQD